MTPAKGAARSPESWHRPIMQKVGPDKHHFQLGDCFSRCSVFSRGKPTPIIGFLFLKSKSVLGSKMDAKHRSAGVCLQAKSFLRLCLAAAASATQHASSTANLKVLGSTMLVSSTTLIHKTPSAGQLGNHVRDLLATFSSKSQGD